MANTIRIQDVVNFCLPHVGFMPLALGSTMQPALGWANLITQVIVSPPFHWNWNRASVDFIAVAGAQNYRHASGWVASTTYAAGAVIIDPAGNGQKVTTAGTAGLTIPTFSAGMFTATSDNTVVWQNVGPLASIPTMPNFGFIDKAQVQDINSTPPIWKEITPKLDLSRDSALACPKFVAAQSDDNLGDITLRLMPVPGSAYPLSINYQQKPALYTSLSQTWSIPDHLFEVYSSGFLALAYMYSEDPRFGAQNQQFVARLIAYSEGLTQTEVTIFLQSWNSILGTGPEYTQRVGQGIAARGNI